MPVIAIRPARPADHPHLVALAALDSAAALEGELLVASIDGEIQAALSVADGRTIADPFRRTTGLLALLRLHAQDAAPAARTRLGRRRRRLALA